MPTETGLKHKPFSSLRGAVAATRAQAQVPRSQAQEPPQTSVRLPLGRVVVREEFDTTEGAVITRVIGAPREHLGALGKHLREALGGVVATEGRDLLVMIGDAERVAAWLRDAGGDEVVVVRRPPPADLSDAGEPGGTVRSQIRRGLRVAIVQKADQGSGALTEGIVHDILTSSPTHPRGIKVRLESGQVGRVRRILAR